MDRENDSMFRLVACDVDGTLLSGDSSRPISDRTRGALDLAREAGIVVVLVSARAPRSIKWVAGLGGITGIAICMNGALVYDLDEDAVVKVWPLDASTVRDVVVRIREELPGVTFHWEKETGFGREPEYEALARPLRDHEIPMRVVCDILEESEPIAKLIARHVDYDSSSLAHRLDGPLDDTVLVTISDPTFVEITASSVTKASALAWVCERLSVLPEQVIAFGDMTNDIPMLSWSGYAVAVGNAHEALKEVADEVAPSNTVDGVAAVLERLLSDTTG